ncbi:MAG: hypothetical protein WA126_02235 [Thermodesulfovibrionales bacterium]
MSIDFSKWSASDFAAWWGAIVATLAVIWNIVVAIRSGARVYVRATPEMQVFPRQPITEDNIYISVTAINRGNSSTTITHFCGYYTKSIWNRIRGKKQAFIVNTDPSLGKTIPYVLRPGEEWSSMANQKSIQEKCAGGLLYIGIIHNQRKRPVYKRVRFRV